VRIFFSDERESLDPAASRHWLR